MTASARDAKVEVERAQEGAALRRELGLFDLVLVQIIMIVGGTWVGTAGKLGAQHAVYWLAASVLFFVPHIAVVIFLNRWLPLEGGLYQWAKVGFNELVGFLVAYNLWLWGVVLLSALGLEVAQMLSYALGPETAWIREGHAMPMAMTVAIILVLAGAALLGLRVGKRIHNAGSLVRLGAYALLLILPIASLVMRRPVDYRPVPIAVPAITLFSLNILGKMGFGAYSGFEYVAIFAGETKNPRRDITRSVAIAAPMVLVMFVLGTSSVLAFVKPEDIDLIAPIPQVVSLGTRDMGWARFLATATSLGFVVTLLGWGTATFAGITRLPMVAGWDGLLPPWFTKLHPTRKTPVNSILFVAAVTIVVGVAALSGVGHQEAFQLSSSAGLVFYALTFIVMFAIPLASRSSTMPAPPWWLRLLCVSGLAMTLLFIALAVFPIIKVKSDLAFTIKVTTVVVVANVVGVLLFAAGKKRRASLAM